MIRLYTSAIIAFFLCSVSNIAWGQSKNDLKQQIDSIYREAQSLTVIDLDSAKLTLKKGVALAQNGQLSQRAFIGEWKCANIEVKKGNTQLADSIFHHLHKLTELVDSTTLYKFFFDYAYMQYAKSDYQEAEKQYDKVISYYKETHNDTMLIQCYINQSKIYTKQNNYPLAMQTLVSASILSDKNKQEGQSALIYNSIGKLYYRQRDFDKCIENFKKALEIQLTLNQPENVATSYQNIGTLYIIKEDYANAETYLKKAGIFFQQTKNTSKYITVLNSLGVMYKRLKNYDEAKTAYSKIIKLAKENNSLLSESNALLNISQVNVEEGKYHVALAQVKESLELSRQAGENDFRDHYQNMAFVYEKLGDYKKAFTWLQYFKQHSDSIVDLNRYNQAEKIKEQYETEKKELQLEKMTLKSETQNLMIQRERIVIASIAVLLIILLISSFVVIKQHKEKLASFKVLVQQNEKIALANKMEREERINKQTISDKVKNDILSRLDHMIQDKTFYKNTEMTLVDLAQEIETNAKYLSAIINETFSMNFSSFINQLRIEESQRLLKEKSHLTIEAIGFESGFKSKSSFNSAFKKVTGITPSVYKKQL